MNLKCERTENAASYLNLTLRLSDDIHAHQFAPGSKKASGNRSNFSVAHNQPIAFCGRHYALRGAGEEDFVGRIQVIHLQTGFTNRDAQLQRQFDDRLPTDSGQAIVQ